MKTEEKMMFFEKNCTCKSVCVCMNQWFAGVFDTISIYHVFVLAKKKSEAISLQILCAPPHNLLIESVLQKLSNFFFHRNEILLLIPLLINSWFFIIKLWEAIEWCENFQIYSGR